VVYPARVAAVGVDPDACGPIAAVAAQAPVGAKIAAVAVRVEQDAIRTQTAEVGRTWADSGIGVVAVGPVEIGATGREAVAVAVGPFVDIAVAVVVATVADLLHASADLRIEVVAVVASAVAVEVAHGVTVAVTVGAGSVMTGAETAYALLAGQAEDVSTLHALDAASPLFAVEPCGAASA
jgi:hypothetical protein